MSSAQKEHLKALKSPDQFQAKAMSLLEWLIGHSKMLVVVLAPVALGVAGVYAYQSFQDTKRNSRAEELGKIQVVYDEEARKVSDEREVLEKKIADPKFAAEKDALSKQAASLKANHSESGAKFQAYFTKYKDKPEGWAAGLTAAESLVDSGKIDEAVSLVESVFTASKGVSFYQTSAGFLLIGLYEQKGELDKALEKVELLAKDATAEIGIKTKFLKGKILYLKNQKDEAKAIFSELVEKNGQSPEAAKAQAILLLLR